MLTVVGEAVVDLLPTDADGGYRARPGGSPSQPATRIHRRPNLNGLINEYTQAA
jgi:hypothetical protein